MVKGFSDFSRTRELFYRTVGDQAETADLQELLSHAFGTFQERYLVSSTGVSPKLFTYKGETGIGSLSLRLLSRYGRAELTALTIKGATENLNAILDGLRGEVELFYNGLHISALSALPSLRFLQKELVRSNPAKVVTVNKASFYLSPGKEENILKNVRFSIPQDDHDDSGTKRFSPLYELADLINVKASYYHGHNPSQELIHESCEIRSSKHSQQGKFNFAYSIKIANDQGMPTSLLPKVEHKFNLIQSDFEILSFRRVRIKDDSISP